MTFKAFSFFLLLAASLLRQAPLVAQPLIQDEARKIPVLIARNQALDQTKLLSIGAGIQYLKSGEKKPQKGRITQISADSLWVNNQGVRLDQIAMIKGKIRSDRQILGGGLLGLGTATMTIGGVLIGSTPGLIVVAGGVGALIGGVILVGGKKKFKTENGWSFHQGFIQIQP
jgi:hypothetical protein